VLGLDSLLPTADTWINVAEETFPMSFPFSSVLVKSDSTVRAISAIPFWDAHSDTKMS
jgi:hypothetical protein